MSEDESLYAGYCKRHPDVATNLGCSRCGDPICPKCLIYTPVGARCPSCANLQRSPLAHTANADVAKAIAAGVGSAVVLSVLYVFILPVFGQLAVILALIAPAGIGYAVGEAVYRASGYRRNNTLAWIAGVSVVAGFASVILIFQALPVGLVGLLVGIFLAVRRVWP